MAKKGGGTKKSKTGRSISNVKRGLQKRNKLVKKGLAKPNVASRYIPNKRKEKQEVKVLTEEEKEQKKKEKIEDDELAYKELADSVSAEDAEFIARTMGSKKGHKRKAELIEEKANSSGDDDDEGAMHEYERLALQRFQTENDKTKNIKMMLPVKTKDGVKTRTIEEEEEESDEEAEDETPMEEDGKDEEEDVAMPGPEVSVAELYARRKELLNDKKVTIGSLASNFIEAPEERIMNLEKLVKMVDAEEPKPIELTVHRLAAGSVLAILIDVTPGYKIHHPELRPNEKLKKDTLKLQRYETTLLRCYKSYLLKLEKEINVLKAKGGGKNANTIKQAGFYLDCMCKLLVAHPHFNFAQNILHAITPLLNHTNEATRTMVKEAVRQTFQSDMRGEISFHAVKLINQLVKSRKHRVKNEVVDVLLALRIKHVDLDKEKDKEIDLKRKEMRKQKLLEKNKISKQEKKRKKKLEVLEKELLEARGEEGRKVKERWFTETTKMAFTIYFRILKSYPQSKLIGSVMEGLAKFAHVINIEFFSDLIAVFQQLINSETLGYRDTLLATSTVFIILSGQGEALNIDPISFYGHLYSTIFQLDAVRMSKEVPLALSVLHMMLVKRRKKVSKARVLAFCKRLSTLCLQLLHNGAAAGLGELRQLYTTHSVALQLLDNEHEVGSGVFDPALPDPEHCSASNTTAWELALLERHYHPPTVRLASHIAAQCPLTGEKSLPQEFKKSSTEIFNDFSMEEMGFNPSIAPPNKTKKGGRGTHVTDLQTWREVSGTVPDVEAGDTSVVDAMDFHASLVAL